MRYRGVGRYAEHMNNHSDKTHAAESCWADVVDEGAVQRASAALADVALAERTTSVFFAVSDPTRFRILEALSAAELCVCDLSRVVGVSQSGVSHQLRLLRDRGLVAFRRDGQRAVYRLADEHVRSLISIGLEHAAEGRL